jgi:hypothetical protein
VFPCRCSQRGLGRHCYRSAVRLLLEVRSPVGEVDWSVGWASDGYSRVDSGGVGIVCHRMTVDCLVVCDIPRIVAGS